MVTNFRFTILPILIVMGVVAILLSLWVGYARVVGEADRRVMLAAHINDLKEMEVSVTPVSEFDDRPKELDYSASDATADLIVNQMESWPELPIVRIRIRQNQWTPSLQKWSAAHPEIIVER